jgi:hypothetical protein
LVFIIFANVVCLFSSICNKREHHCVHDTLGADRMRPQTGIAAGYITLGGLPACRPACLPACLLACLPACLLACLYDDCLPPSCSLHLLERLPRTLRLQPETSWPPCWQTDRQSYWAGRDAICTFCRLNSSFTRKTLNATFDRFRWNTPTAKNRTLLRPARPPRRRWPRRPF